MTIPTERTRAVMRTRDFLQKLTDCEAMPDVPEEVRHEARALLRHYPSMSDMDLAHKACPMWFGTPMDVA
jgi:hypothetical protein